MKKRKIERGTEDNGSFLTLLPKPWMEFGTLATYEYIYFTTTSQVRKVFNP